MRQRFVQIDGVLVPADQATADAVAPYVMPDIEPFKANTGAYIEGRRQWREHLRDRGCTESSPQEMIAGTQKWNAKKAEHRAKLEKARALAPAVEPRGEFVERPLERSRLHAEVLNRLHGKPAPSRKEVIKLSLDLAKRGRYAGR